MRNPRHPFSHLLPALAALLVLLAACGSGPATESTAIDETSDPISDTDTDEVGDELSDPVEPDHATTEASTEAATVVDSSSDGSTETTGSGTVVPTSWVEPLLLFDDPSAADRYAADVGMLSATGADVDIWVDSTFHQPPPTGAEREVVFGADGDGAGGIVWTTATGVHHLRADGSQITLLDGLEPESIHLLDVADSSLGPLALLLRTDGTAQFLLGTPLDQPDTVAFEIAASNPGWRTTHAALIGDDTDRILVSGGGDGCLGLAAIDFAGDLVDLPNVVLVSGAIVDPAAGSDVCADGTSMIAAWDPSGIVTMVTGNGADPVTITVIDTTGGDDWASTWQPNIGPTEAKFLDVDLTPTGVSTALVVDEWNGSLRFDPGRLFDRSEINIVLGSGTPSAMPPQMMALAPGFTDAQANVGGEIEGAAPEEALPDGQ